MQILGITFLRIVDTENGKRLLIGSDNNGFYSWDIPVAQTVGTDYKIKICGMSSTTICTESPSYFTIH